MSETNVGAYIGYIFRDISRARRVNAKRKILEKRVRPDFSRSTQKSPIKTRGREIRPTSRKGGLFVTVLRRRMRGRGGNSIKGKQVPREAACIARSWLSRFSSVLSYKTIVVERRAPRIVSILHARYACTTRTRVRAHRATRTHVPPRTLTASPFAPVALQGH